MLLDLKFSDSLLKLEFQKGHGDHTLFVRSRADAHVIVLVYVDDIIISSTNDSATTQLIANLKRSFKLRELGPLKYFLGLEVARTTAGISLCQRNMLWNFYLLLECLVANHHQYL